jgi:hypothetical protein
LTNPIQQLSPVPVQTPPLANNGNFTLGWIQWFQAVLNSCKVIPIPSTNVPVNPTTPVSWQQVNYNGQTFYIPMYQ